MNKTKRETIADGKASFFAVTARDEESLIA
jgi:hypothetical protein